MACCCKSCRSNKSSTSCLGRCDLPKHRCLHKIEVKPGPIPRNMGWHYTAYGAPTHQLRCGWRPGHIACSVLKLIEQHNSSKGECCKSPCRPPSCPRVVCCGSTCGGCSLCLPGQICKPPICKPAPCKPYPCKPYPCKPSPCKPSPCKPLPCCKPSPYKPGPCRTCKSPAPSCCNAGPPSDCLPLIRIVRHAGNYMISTKPSNENNSPSGPYPLKYVLNPSNDNSPSGTAKYCIEAKYNDYYFDYTCSQASFVVDFTPPESACQKICLRKKAC